MEDCKKPPLENRLEINHHVPAAYEIQLPEGRIRQHVVGRENDHAADVLADMVLVAALRKVFGKTLRGNVVDDAVGKDAAPGLLDGLYVDIRGKIFTSLRIPSSSITSLNRMAME